MLGQRLAKFIDLRWPHQPGLRGLLHELAELLQQHQGLGLVARAQAHIGTHIHVGRPHAQIKLHKPAAQAHRGRNVLVLGQQPQHQLEQLLDARLRKGAQDQQHALVRHVGNLGNARGRLVQAVRIQALVVAGHPGTALAHGLHHLDAGQALGRHQRGLDRHHGIRRRTLAADDAANAVADHILNIHPRRQVHIGARVVGQVQAVHILARQPAVQALQLHHRVRQRHADHAVRQLDGCQHRIFMALHLLVLQLAVARHQHPAPLGHAVAVVVAADKALEQPHLLQRPVRTLCQLVPQIVRLLGTAALKALDRGHIGKAHLRQLRAGVGHPLPHQAGVFQALGRAVDQKVPRRHIAQLHLAALAALQRHIPQQGLLQPGGLGHFGLQQLARRGFQHAHGWILGQQHQLLLAQALELFAHRVRLHPLGAHHPQLGQQRILEPVAEQQKPGVVVPDHIVHQLGGLLGIGRILRPARQKLADVVPAEKRLQKIRQRAFNGLEHIPAHHLGAAVHLVAQRQAQVVLQIALLLTPDAAGQPAVRILDLTLQHIAERVTVHCCHHTIPMLGS